MLSRHRLVVGEDHIARFQRREGRNVAHDPAEGEDHPRRAVFLPDLAVAALGVAGFALPGFAFDGKDVWSAREAVDLPEVPGRLVVIGGGVIGLELGTVYAKLGAQVTFLEALPQLLTGLDPDAVRLVQKGLRQRKAVVHVGARATGWSMWVAATSVPPSACHAWRNAASA